MNVNWNDLIHIQIQIIEIICEFTDELHTNSNSRTAGKMCDIIVPGDFTRGTIDCTAVESKNSEQ